MKKILLPIMAFSLFGLLCCRAQEDDRSTAAFADALENTPAIRLIDVRTAEEYAAGHLRGAVNLDYFAKDFVQQVQAAYDTEEPVYVYCRSGRRSADAARQLKEAGYRVFNMLGGYIAWTDEGREVTKYEVERFATKNGKLLEITLIKHGSVEIRFQGHSYQFDPVTGLGKPTDFSKEFPKASAILVTHEHGDHLDAKAIEQLSGEGTLLLLNEKSRAQIGKGEAIGNGQTRELPGDILVEAVPAYNTTPGREMFHPQGNGNGYVVTFDGLRIYIAGDTEDVPEMADLREIDIAFLPVNQPYTMTVEQCIAAAKVIKPRILIPYHFSQTDLSSVPGALPGIDVRLRQMQ